MADDIVTRLREARTPNCYGCVEYGYDDECDCTTNGILHNDAADEIERLRENNEYLHDVIASLRGEVRELEAALPDPPPQHTPVRSTPLTVQPPKEARRG